MTLQIGERIKIAEFIEKLSTLTFDEVTHDKVVELFPNSYVEGVNELNAGQGFRTNDLKDMYIDDYVFTIHRVTDEEGLDSGFKLNDTICLSDYVEVWLVCDNIGSNDIQASGKIKKQANHYYLDVEYSVD